MADKNPGLGPIYFSSCFGILTLLATAGTVLNLFAIKIGATVIEIGVLNAALQFFVILQLLVAPWVDTHGKKKYMAPAWFLSAFFSAFMLFVPGICAHAGRRAGIYALIGIICLCSVCNNLASTGWFPLLQDLVPETIRGRFFGKMRTVWQAVSIVFLLVTGYYLGVEAPVHYFQFIFALGVLFGLGRAFAVMKIPEGLPPHSKAEAKGLMDAYRQPLSDANFRVFLFFIILWNFCAGLSAPYFVVFMKDVLNESNFFIMICTALISAGWVLSLWVWGRLCDLYSSRPVFSLTLIALIIDFGLWIFLKEGNKFNQVILIAIFILQGVATAGLSIAVVHYLFDLIPREGQSRYWALHTSLSALAGGVGPLIGGILLNLFSSLHVRWMDNFRILFLLNALCVLFPMYMVKRIKFSGRGVAG